MAGGRKGRRRARRREYGMCNSREWSDKGTGNEKRRKGICTVRTGEE